MVKGVSDYEFVVEKVLGKKKIRGVVHYKIKWMGYPIKDATWEPTENLLKCKYLLNEFEEKLRKKKNRGINHKIVKNNKNKTNQKKPAEFGNELLTDNN